MTQETVEQAVAPDHAPQVQIKPDQSLELNASQTDASNIVQGTKEQATTTVQIHQEQESGTQQATPTQQLPQHNLTNPRK